MPTRQRRFSALLRLPPSPARKDFPSVSSGPSSPEAADPTVSYLADLLADTREELSRVDSKAALLLAAVGVILGALIAGSFGGHWTPLDLNYGIQWMWWLGVTAAAFGILAIAASVYPRIHQSGTPRPGVPKYYGDVAAYENIEAFGQAIEKPPISRGRLINQTFVLSHIVQRKYVLLRRGLRFLLLAISACILAAIINIPLGR